MRRLITSVAERNAECLHVVLAEYPSFRNQNMDIVWKSVVRVCIFQVITCSRMHILNDYQSA
jgi:hypothetical protein